MRVSPHFDTAQRSAADHELAPFPELLRASLKERLATRDHSRLALGWGTWPKLPRRICEELRPEMREERLALGRERRASARAELPQVEGALARACARVG
ncbi:MAG: hypothetical protein ACREOA_02840 [Candidatus Dormibacteria bacterium]